jgi:hypothetical protein
LWDVSGMAPSERRFSLISRTPGLGHTQARRNPQPLRARLLDIARTLLLVIPLTVLIWIYAEREQQVRLSDVGVAVDVKTSQPDRVVTVLAPEDRRLLLDLEGPRDSIEKIRDELSGRRQPLLLLLGDEYQPGPDREVNVLSLLDRSEPFRDTPVSIRSVRPALKVRIEARGRRVARVEQNPRTRIVGTVTFDPQTVEISGPVSALARLPEGTLLVYADMAQFLTLTPGTYTREVALTMPYEAEGLDALKPVRATVVKRDSDTVVVPFIPVVVQIPAAVLEKDRYRITVTPVTLPNVNVAGPPDAIKLLTDNKFAAAAVLELTPDEATTPGEGRTKRLGPANYRMPKDVTVTDPERDITFSVVDKGT